MAKIKIWIISVFLILIGFSSFSQCYCLVEKAESYLYVREATGNNDGPIIEYFIGTTGLDPKGEFAWCAAMINAIHLECGLQTPSSGAWSPAWFPEEKTIYVYRKQDNLRPLPGDVGGIYFKSKQRIAHVLLIVEWEDKVVKTIEGNTNDAGSREGDGVYKKRRLRKQIQRVSRWH